MSGIATDLEDNEEEGSAAQQILRYEREVNEALRRLSKRTHWEAATVDTPLDSVLASEDGMLDEWGVRKETVRRLFDYFLGDGPHPAQILRRLYAIGRHMRIEPFCLMNLREMALMLGDSHGAQHWRMKRICIDPLVRAGARSVKAPGQKGIAASAAAAKAQRGNKNRAKSAIKKKTPKRKTNHEIQKGKIHSRNGSKNGRTTRSGHTRGRLGIADFCAAAFPSVARDDHDPAGPARPVADESADTL